MEKLSKSDLRKLSAVCMGRLLGLSDYLKSGRGSGLEQALARFEIDRLEELCDKLDRIADSERKRVEITNG